MAYEPELDKILAEEGTLSGNYTVRIMSYNNGKPKICIISSKTGYPIKRFPVEEWENIEKIIEDLIPEAEEKLQEFE